MCIYVRPITAEEREEIETLSRSSDRITYRRCRMVLLSADRYTVSDIAKALGQCTRTVRNTLHLFDEKGVAALPHRKAKGPKPILDDAGRDALLEVLCQSPQNFGIQSALWTAEDLASVAVDKGICDSISANTVRRVVMSCGKSWQRAKRWSSPDADYGQKKGRLSVSPNAHSPSRHGVLSTKTSRGSSSCRTKG